MISILLHSIPMLLMLLLGSGQGNGADGGNANSKHTDNGDLLPKPNDEPIEVTVTEYRGPALEKPKPAVPHAEDNCPDHYGGIGIVHSFVDSTVTSAPEGYPAANAGIKAGDQILTPLSTLRGEIGTEVEVEYVNHEGYHKVTLIRDKICTSAVLGNTP